MKWWSWNDKTLRTKSQIVCTLQLAQQRALGLGSSALNVWFNFLNCPALPRNNRVGMLRSWDPTVAWNVVHSKITLLFWWNKHCDKVLEAAQCTRLETSFMSTNVKLRKRLRYDLLLTVTWPSSDVTGPAINLDQEISSPSFDSPLSLV